MPILKAAKKDLKQSKKRYVRNLKRKRVVQDVFKKMRVLADGGKIDDAVKLLPEAYKALDKAAKRGIITKNTASRKKSRITKRLQKTRA
ncbi:MAG: 30S ribosomal protein S20 [Candidatus Niyogibacteria bacterium CG10_big_fil_rev_8_21_14_0_10_46_36]|uniref:Small ribosomal subunit protein bS20 n=1 Tax=Candidatus Niyogibacteria bacterium CG10_big_fil_rev_8_21_14_0_10_46_36 TaxID=1974726 RepID=A0A2H0TF14_9BACT|nr:MAG: 30S ribosomal protein S20 [Candidatus Niyogibacteria bacterium CG10_big_fil_rev_8_21_14_0_10_46_36]